MTRVWIMFGIVIGIFAGNLAVMFTTILPLRILSLILLMSCSVLYGFALGAYAFKSGLLYLSRDGKAVRR
jgi:hypothetical protein